jgi:hypothetical protein
MNIISEMRKNAVDAVKSMAGMDGVSVEAVARVEDCWALPNRSIGVAWMKLDDSADGDPPIGTPLSQMVFATFAVVVKADSAASNTDALSREGYAEDLLASVSFHRAADIGTAKTGPVRLRLFSSHVVPDPNRTPGGAGPIAIATIFRTSEFEY